ncbi:MAG: FtsX-like permease family protein, partial [Bacteroidota bacterium]
AVLAVLFLVGNSLLLIVRTRVKETAILQTIGYSRVLIAVLVLIEGMAIGLLGGLVGVTGSLMFFHFQAFTFGNEGLTLALVPSVEVFQRGILIAVLLALLASVYPAWKSTSRPLIQTLNA